MYRNILVAIDGSDTAHEALDHAIGLAEALRARLTVMSVVPEIPAFVYRAPIDLAALEQDTQKETERWVREAVERVPGSVSVTSVVRVGGTAEGISSQIAEGQHDLLVMGSRGRGRLATTLLGSVGAEVHYHAHIPMLVVHPASSD